MRRLLDRQRHRRRGHRPRTTASCAPTSMATPSPTPSETDANVGTVERRPLTAPTYTRTPTSTGPTASPPVAERRHRQQQRRHLPHHGHRGQRRADLAAATRHHRRGHASLTTASCAPTSMRDTLTYALANRCQLARERRTLTAPSPTTRTPTSTGPTASPTGQRRHRRQQRRRPTTSTVDQVNDAPVADDDTATVAEDDSVTLDTARQRQRRSGRRVGPDPDRSPSSATRPTAPPSSARWPVTYTPDANYNGPDSFSYTVQTTAPPTAADRQDATRHVSTSP